MQASFYPAQTVYVAPTPAPVVFGVETVTIKEMLDAPATKAILIEEAPNMKFVLQSAQALTHISNWTPAIVREIGLITPEALARIDTRMRALPAAQRPAL